MTGKIVQQSVCVAEPGDIIVLPSDGYGRQIVATVERKEEWPCGEERYKNETSVRLHFAGEGDKAAPFTKEWRYSSECVGFLWLVS